MSFCVSVSGLNVDRCVLIEVAEMHIRIISKITRLNRVFGCRCGVIVILAQTRLWLACGHRFISFEGIKSGHVKSSFES